MSYVVITKTVGDLVKRPPEHLKSHPGYPLECVEGINVEDLRAQYPGKAVWPMERYLGYKAAMNLMHGKIQVPPRPWWKFWGKA